MQRPFPPEHLREPGFLIEPANEVADWLQHAFVREDAALMNPDHEHLRVADLACLWTNVPYIDGFMPVVGAAELVKVQGKPWPKAEKTDHLCLMHGHIPDMRIWLYAPFLATCDDASFCAVVEHELYHFAQKLDKDGIPKFDPDGKPMWAQRAHDVEEFVGIARRYGVAACRGRAKEFVAAAQSKPLIARAQIAGICGTCGDAI
jgi:hypothetical protein